MVVVKCMANNNNMEDMVMPMEVIQMALGVILNTLGMVDTLVLIMVVMGVVTMDLKHLLVVGVEVVDTDPTKKVTKISCKSVNIDFRTVSSFCPFLIF